MGGSLGVQGLVENLLRGADVLDGGIDPLLPARDGGIRLLGPLGDLGAQRVRLPHQGFGLAVLLISGGFSGAGLEESDLGRTLLCLPAGILAALGFTRLARGHLGGQVHGLLGIASRLLEGAIRQRPARLLLVFGDLALTILGGLVLAHPLALDVANALLRGHREAPLLLLDPVHLGQVPVRLGIQGIDVTPILGERLRHRLTLGREDLVLDPLDVGRSLSLCLPLATGSVDPGCRLLIDERHRLGRGLPA